MPRIFVSYRRSDSKGFTGALVRELTEHFLEDEIFLDIQDIEAGQDFVNELDQALELSDVVLVVIGESWLEVTDAEGRRRLDNPRDFVRREVEASLRRDDVKVIPVLVGGAKMPAPDVLPEKLSRLSRRQAFEISNSRWDDDVERLIKTLRDGLGPMAGLSPVPKLLGRLFALVGAALLIGGLVPAYLSWSFARQAMVVEATVDEIEQAGEEPDAFYYPIYKYTAEDGRWHRLRSEIGYGRPEHFVGDEVTLLVDTVDPRKFKIKSSPVGLPTILLGGLGVLFLTLGFVFVRLRF